MEEKRRFLIWLKLHVHPSKLLYNIAKKMTIKQLEANEYHNNLEKSVIYYYRRFKGINTKPIKEAKEVKKMKIIDKILSTLKEEPATASELCKKTASNKIIIKSTLEDLLNDNIIKKTSDGKYYLPKKKGKIVLSINLRNVMKYCGKSELIDEAIRAGNWE